MSLWDRVKRWAGGASREADRSLDGALEVAAQVASSERVEAGPALPEIGELGPSAEPDLAGLSDDQVVAALQRARAEGRERSFLAAVLRRPLGERSAGAVARVLAERGERARAISVLEPTMSPDNLMLLAELAAEERDFPRATATLERVLAHDIATPGAVERHAHYREMLGASVLRPVRRRDEATVATANPETTSYRILREVGRGGAGTVYEAFDEALGRRIAFKVFHRRGADADALLREARLASMLGPRFAVRVFDADPEQGWVAMEWAGLGSLRDVFARSSAPSDSWVLPLAEALAALHAVGVVHGDLKPGNVLLRAEDSPLLADFGVARRAGEEPGGGSAAYLSPERLGGARTSFSDDVYAFGRVLEDASRAAERAGGSLGGRGRLASVTVRCLGPADERPRDGTKLIELLRGS